MTSVQSTPDGAEYSKPATKTDADTSCSRLEIEPAVGGGFVAQCFTDSGGNGPYTPPKKYALKDRAALDNLLDDLFGAADESAPESDVETQAQPSGTDGAADQ